MRFAVRVANEGSADATGPIPVAFYAVDDHRERLIEVVELSGLAAGSVAPVIELELSRYDVGRRGFLAVVNDDGTGARPIVECHEAAARHRFAPPCE